MAHRVTARRRSPCPGRSRRNDAIPRAASSVRPRRRTPPARWPDPSASGPSRPPVDRGLGQAVGHQWAARQLRGPGQGGLEHEVGCHHAVHQSDRQCLLGSHRAAGEDQLLGPRDTDEPRQALRAASARDHPEQDLGQTEAGVLGADPEVAGQRELQPAAEGDAVDGGNGGPRHRGQRAERGGEVGAHRVRAAVAQLDDVGSGREDPPPAPQHHRPGGSSCSSVATACSCASTGGESALALGRSSRISATPSGRRSRVTKVSAIAAPYRNPCGRGSFGPAGGPPPRRGPARRPPAP